MVKKKNYFTVGVFVIIGLFIGVGAIVWVGASQYFQKGSRYVTYFNESVQGLQIDSSVKYLGVDVGRVERIRVAPDSQVIEVVMKIAFRANLERTTVATLKMAGITGIVFVELDRVKPKDLVSTPTMDFSPPYPVIPSRPSDIKQITTSIDEIIQRFRKIDFNAIADQVKSTTRSMETFINNDKLQKIITNLDSMAANLEGVTHKIHSTLAKGTVDEILEEAKNTVREVREIAARLKEDVRAVNVAGTAAKVNGTIDGLNGTIDGLNGTIDGLNTRMNRIANEIQVTAENLKQASETLEDFLERVSADPSDLIFSEPPQKNRGKEQGKR
jgi:phospholipid/cholesterol/gamma-HCH transport system substrate-binding protein